MTLPSISAVIPTFNRARDVEAAVRSVCAQTLRPREVIVVDNGSEDETPEVLAGLREEFGPILRVERQDNRGEAGSRNTGVRLAGGELVAFLDDDDTWEPQKLERQVALFTRDPGLGLAFTSYMRVGSSGETLVRLEHFDPDPNSVVLRLLSSCFVQTSTVMVRRSTLADVGPFDGSMLFSDWPMWLRVAARGHRFAYLDEPLSRYGWHGANISRAAIDTSETALRMAQDFFAVPDALTPKVARHRGRTFARWYAEHAFNALAAGNGALSRASFSAAARARPLAVRPGWIAGYAQSFACTRLRGPRGRGA